MLTLSIKETRQQTQNPLSSKFGHEKRPMLDLEPIRVFSDPGKCETYHGKHEVFWQEKDPSC